MKMNALWQLPNNVESPDLIDRSIRIDTRGGLLTEANCWGHEDDYPAYGEDNNPYPCLLREVFEDSEIVTAMVDTPFTIKYWDTQNDDPYCLHWNGIQWETMSHVELGDEDEYVMLQDVTVESLIYKVLRDFGLDYLTPNSITNNKILLEFVNRDNFNTSWQVGSYYYRSIDSDKFIYTADAADIPPLAELDFIHYLDDTDPLNNFMYIFFDDDLPTSMVLSSLIKHKGPRSVYLLQSDSHDFVDKANLVKTTIAEDLDASTHYYIVECKTESATTTNLFFNMHAFFPLETAYIFH